MEMRTARWPPNVGVAWVSLSLVLAIHVADEAGHDFLTMYNANASAIRARISWLPVPKFSFKSWIVGLFTAVVLLLAISPFAFRREGAGVRWIRPLAWLFAAIMVVNALNHIAASVYLHRLAPGVESAPLLLFGGLYLGNSLLRTRLSQRMSPDLHLHSRRRASN